ncbi:YfhE family protein [Lentibacillus lipolyticus]|nr:YfhE family protein [Lentibacillus lipolyticus]
MKQSQYQPTKDKQLTDAQEVHFAKPFKQADIAGGFRRATTG